MQNTLIKAIATFAPSVGYVGQSAYLQDYEMKVTPLKIQVGNWYVQRVMSVSVVNSMKQFIDTVTIGIHLGEGDILKKVKFGDVVKAYYRSDNGAEKLIFDGYYENLKAGSKDASAQMICRSKIKDLAEDDMPPKNFKKTTDNALIKEALSGWTGKYDLDPAVAINEEQSSPGNTRAEFAERIAKRTGFHLYVIGDTVYKKKIATSGSPSYFLYETKNDNKNNVLDLNIDVSTMNVRGKVNAYQNAVKARQQRKISQTVDTDTEVKMFAQKYKINTKIISSVEVSAKDKGEAQRNIEMAKAAAEPQEFAMPQIKNWYLVPENSVSVFLQSDLLNVKSNFIPIERTFVMDNEGLMSTALTLIPQGRNFYA